MPNTTNHARAVLPVGTGVSQCGACGLVFKSLHSFDKHRTGPADVRRCLTIIEMLADGMSRNERGQWVASTYDRTA